MKNEACQVVNCTNFAEDEFVVEGTGSAFLVCGFHKAILKAKAKQGDLNNDSADN